MGLSVVSGVATSQREQIGGVWLLVGHDHGIADSVNKPTAVAAENEQNIDERDEGPDHGDAADEVWEQVAEECFEKPRGHSGRTVVHCETEDFFADGFSLAEEDEIENSETEHRSEDKSTTNQRQRLAVRSLFANLSDHASRQTREEHDEAFHHAGSQSCEASSGRRNDS